MKALILILSSLLLVACENAPSRREDMLAEHPEWDSKTVELVRLGYLNAGMTMEQVKAAWGRPCWSCVGTTKGTWGESWEYQTQMVFFDPAGKLIRWQPK
ncbi:MAG: hypothetical protein HOP02_04745 [Methylococcaceae bacterium]|nr:hypothetical protein [Methylococcaceae bacterium]